MLLKILSRTKSTPAIINAKASAKTITAKLSLTVCDRFGQVTCLSSCQLSLKYFGTIERFLFKNRPSLLSGKGTKILFYDQNSSALSNGFLAFVAPCFSLRGFAFLLLVELARSRIVCGFLAFESFLPAMRSPLTLISLHLIYTKSLHNL